MANYEHIVKEISDLVPYINNSREHSEEQVAQVAASMKEWGFTNPVLIDESNGIVAGHCRVQAAKKLGISDIPCIILAGLSEAQRKAYVIADNKLALNASWDIDLLKLELQELGDLDFDLDLIGFDSDELANLLNDPGDGLTDEDEIGEPPDAPVSVAGDVWLLGKHRLVCGDSTDADTVAKCLNGVEPHLMVTDPPYGVEYDANWRNEADRANGKPYGASAVGKVENDDNPDWSEAWALFPGDVAYVWHGGRVAGLVAESLEACGFEIRSQIIWAKNNIAISRGHYHWQHEPCWYAVRKGKPGSWHGDRKQSTIWNIDKPLKSETGHSTQKPVECMRRPIENNSSPGQAVYEPFSGSGTTIIACETTGRVCHAIELNPAYVDMAIMRWQNFTGEKATNQSGELFDDLKADTDDT